jgi:hypothetical protein
MGIVPYFFSFLRYGIDVDRMDAWVVSWESLLGIDRRSLFPADSGDALSIEKCQGKEVPVSDGI